MITSFTDSQNVQRLLAVEGWQVEQIVQQMGAANRHKVFLLEDYCRRAVLKIHETSVAGRRDTFAHEALMHGFYAEQAGDMVPEMIAHDMACRAMIFEHVAGTTVASEEISISNVAGMAEFLLETNRSQVLERARQEQLPVASDAGFTPAEHWQCAMSRSEALLALPLTDETTLEMQDFVRTELQPALVKIKPDPSPLAQPCLSPSDFGFHNVIRRANGSFCFFDFEHAGWDDPAKLVADLILQPEAPLSSDVAQVLMDVLQEGTIFGPQLSSNVRRMLPLQKCKWTTIILNVFDRLTASAETKSARLAKAAAYWRSDFQN